MFSPVVMVLETTPPSRVAELMVGCAFNPIPVWSVGTGR